MQLEAFPDSDAVREHCHSVTLEEVRRKKHWFVRETVFDCNVIAIVATIHLLLAPASRAVVV